MCHRCVLPVQQWPTSRLSLLGLSQRVTSSVTLARLTSVRSSTSGTILASAAIATSKSATRIWSIAVPTTRSAGWGAVLALLCGWGPVFVRCWMGDMLWWVRCSVDELLWWMKCSLWVRTFLVDNDGHPCHRRWRGRRWTAYSSCSSGSAQTFATTAAAPRASASSTSCVRSAAALTDVTTFTLQVASLS